jgi:hypothetical protein
MVRGGSRVGESESSDTEIQVDKRDDRKPDYAGWLVSPAQRSSVSSGSLRSHQDHASRTTFARLRRSPPTLRSPQEFGECLLPGDLGGDAHRLQLAGQRHTPRRLQLPLPTRCCLSAFPRPDGQIARSGRPPNHKIRSPCAAASHGTGRPTLRQRDRGPEVGTRSGSSAIDVRHVLQEHWRLLLVTPTRS